MTDSHFNEALTRLDAEIAETEARLADLRLKRKGAEAFLAYMQGVSGRASVEPRRALSASGTSGLTDLVESVVHALAGESATVDEVLALVQQARPSVTRDQVRNALHYLGRKKLLVNAGRGSWRLRDTEAPAATEASVSNIRPDQEGGDSREMTVQTASTTESEHHSHLGAPLAGLLGR